MALANYSDLLAKIATYAWRDGDDDFTDEAADIVQMATARLNRVLPLRVMEVDATLSASAGATTVALPSDFLEPIALSLTTFNPEESLLAFVASDLPSSTDACRPEQYAINGANIEFGRPLDQGHTFKFRYRKSFALSEAVPTNWLLTNNPDIMLAACLVWGGLYMRDTEELQKWKMVLEEGINELSWLDARSKALAPLKTELAGLKNGSFNINSGR